MRLSRHSIVSVIVLGAFLLFLVEPMAAKQLLPLFGGTATVWTTCLVFFQAGVLAGYGYAHWLAGRLPGLRWLHITLLLLASIVALGWAGSWMQPVWPNSPILGILGSLVMFVGLPFGILASTTPLMQTLWVQTQRGGLPYWLFGLSNATSLAALFLYPAVLEAHTTLHFQKIFWAGGVIFYAALTLHVLATTRTAAVTGVSQEQPRDAAINHDQGQHTSKQHRLLWFILPLTASMQLSAVTGHLVANVAAMPLLWVLPLAAYLLSFVIAFDLPCLYNRRIVTRLLLVLMVALGYLLSRTDMTVPTGTGIVFFVAELLLACIFLHAQTFAVRPQRLREMTGFYLTVAAGGAVGATLAGIAAPLLFNANYDLPIVFLVTALTAVPVVWSSGWPERAVWLVSAGLASCLVLAVAGAYRQDALWMSRSYYGSLRVKALKTALGEPLRILLNGQTEHGSQILTPAKTAVPTTYYAPDSGIGLVMATVHVNQPRSVGVIGLGAGTLAAYGRAGDRMRFYEINPAVRPVAREFFQYLRQSRASISIVDGDARQILSAETPQAFDILVVDAFSGDSIPVHLLTREAMAIYRRHLAPGGILAFHISNRYVDLAPEVRALAQDQGLHAVEVVTPANEATGEFTADWMLVGPAAYLGRPEVQARAKPAVHRADIPPWSDEFSSLLPLMRW